MKNNDNSIGMFNRKTGEMKLSSTQTAIVLNGDGTAMMAIPASIMEDEECVGLKLYTAYLAWCLDGDQQHQFKKFMEEAKAKPESVIKDWSL
jgi:hypothetical protein